MEDIKQDILELQNLLGQATRDGVKSALQADINRLQTQLESLELSKAQKDASELKTIPTPVQVPNKSTPDPIFSTEAIKNYSWDQESDLVR